MPLSVDPSWRAAEAAASDGLLDLRSLWSTFSRRLSLLIVIVVVMLGAAMAITSAVAPIYSTTSTVLLDPRQQSAISLDAAFVAPETSSAVVDTEVQVLQSRALAERVVRALDLTNDPDFNPALNADAGGGLLSGVKTWLKGLLSGGADDQDVAQDPVTVAAGILMDMVNVTRRGVTYVLDITASSTRPETAMAIANAYADAYLVDQLEAKFEATERTNNWLAERLAVLREDVEAKERAVETFRASAGLLNAEGRTLTEQQIAELNAQAVLRRTEYAAAQANLETVRRQMAAGNADEIAEVQGSEVIRQLRQQRADVTRQQADLLSRYGERHPDVITIQRQLADIDSSLELEANRIVASLESAVTIASQRVAAIESSVADLRGQLSSDNQSSVQLRQLEREAEASRALFESFLSRFEESTAEETLQEADARIISQAPLPLAPSFPNWKLNVALGLIVGLIVGIAAVFLVEAFDRGMSTTADVETTLGATSLGLIPRVPRAYRKRAADYVLDKPLSGFAEALRSLKATLTPMGESGRGRVIMFTSAVPGEGKTATALAFARVSAMSGSRTLVIDTDTRRRTLTAQAHLRPKAGLMDVLAGACPLDKAIVREERTGMYVLPLSGLPGVGGSELGRPQMRELLEQLRSQFETIVIDTAPALPVSEPKILGPLVDQVVLLARWRATSRDLVRAAWANLAQVKAPVAGVALSNVNLAAAARDGYGYAYGGRYFKSYSDYNAN